MSSLKPTIMSKGILWIKGLIIIVLLGVSYLIVEPEIVDCGRLTVTTEEATQGDNPEYKPYEYGSHDYENYSIIAHYPSGLTRKIPFHPSMVSSDDYEKFNTLGKHEIEVTYQKAKSVIKIEVILSTGLSNHIVIFQSNGGNLIPDIVNIPHSSTIQLPIPIKSGHVFLGWYLDEHFSGNPFNNQVPVTSSMVLYAKWEEMLS